MGSVRSGVIVVAGPNPAQTRALRARDKANFSFQFVNDKNQPIGSPTSSQVTIVSVRNISGGTFAIIYVLGHETRSMTYNASNGKGVVRP